MPTSLSPPFTLRVTEIVGIEKSDVRLKSILIQSLINQTGWDFFSKSWQIPAQWRTTDGFTCRLDCITDDRGLFSLSYATKPSCRDGFTPVIGGGTGWYCAPGYLP